MRGANPQPGGAVVVLTTVRDTNQAGSLARDLVSRRLAACVTALPSVRSTYSWENAVHEDEEVLLVIKTPSERLDELQQFLEDRHPYELPEILVLPVERGSVRYMDWLRAATHSTDTEEG
jgi:periplasmic divalent cation tolerance protein